MIINGFGDGGTAGLNLTSLSAGATIWNDGVLNSALTIVDDSYGGHGSMYNSAYLPTGYDGTDFFGIERGGYKFYNELINFAPLIGKTITADIYSGTTSSNNYTVTVGLNIVFGYGPSGSTVCSSTTVSVPKGTVIGGKVGTVTLTIPSYATFGMIIPYYTSGGNVAVWYGGNNMKISN